MPLPNSGRIKLRNTSHSSTASTQFTKVLSVLSKGIVPFFDIYTSYPILSSIAKTSVSWVSKSYTVEETNTFMPFLSAMFKVSYISSSIVYSANRISATILSFSTKVLHFIQNSPVFVDYLGDLSHKFGHAFSFVGPLFAQSFPYWNHGVYDSLYSVKVSDLHDDLRFTLSCRRLKFMPRCMLSIDRWSRTNKPRVGESVGKLLTYRRLSEVCTPETSSLYQTHIRWLSYLHPVGHGHIIYAVFNPALSRFRGHSVPE